MTYQTLQLQPSRTTLRRVRTVESWGAFFSEALGDRVQPALGRRRIHVLGDVDFQISQMKTRIDQDMP